MKDAHNTKTLDKVCDTFNDGASFKSYNVDDATVTSEINENDMNQENGDNDDSSNDTNYSVEDEINDAIYDDENLITENKDDEEIIKESKQASSSSTWQDLINFWDDDLTLQEKYIKFYEMDNYLCNHEIMIFIANSIKELSKLNSDNVAVLVTMHQASPLFKDVMNRIENDDNKEDISYWKLLLDDIPNRNNNEDENNARVLSYMNLQVDIKDEDLHRKIMKERSHMVQRCKINKDDALHLILKRYKKAFADLERNVIGSDMDMDTDMNTEIDKDLNDSTSFYKGYYV